MAADQAAEIGCEVEGADVAEDFICIRKIHAGLLDNGTSQLEQRQLALQDLDDFALHRDTDSEVEAVANSNPAQIRDRRLEITWS
ncbi:hypothetical protein D3C74_483900 [compost metagenome]